ncbi:hypothetical protein Vafri_9845, partial [Volvox africanus]
PMPHLPSRPSCNKGVRTTSRCNFTYLASSSRPAMLSPSPSATAPAAAARTTGDSASALNFREANGIVVTVAGAPATATRTPLHSANTGATGKGTAWPMHMVDNGHADEGGAQAERGRVKESNEQIGEQNQH